MSLLEYIKNYNEIYEHVPAALQECMAESRNNCMKIINNPDFLKSKITKETVDLLLSKIETSLVNTGHFSIIFPVVNVVASENMAELTQTDILSQTFQATSAELDNYERKEIMNINYRSGECALIPRKSVLSSKNHVKNIRKAVSFIDIIQFIRQHYLINPSNKSVNELITLSGAKRTRFFQAVKAAKLAFFIEAKNKRRVKK